MNGQEQESKSTGANGSGNNDDRTNSERDGSENHIPVVVLYYLKYVVVFIFLLSI